MHLNTALPESKAATLPAKYIYEALYALAMYRHYPEGGLVTREMMQEFLSDPTVQIELARQQRDLDEITAACQQPDGLLALIPTLRVRAIAEAITFE